MDESLFGTSCWQRFRSAVGPDWSWQFSLLQEPQAYVTRMGCCPWGPGIGKSHFGLIQICSGHTTILWNCGIRFTMVANVIRAPSSAVEAFWKKSFQTSTGNGLWLCSEQFINVATLLAVRCVALGKIRQEVKQRVSELMEISITRVMKPKPNLSLGFTAYVKQSYRGAGILSDGEIAQGLWGTVNRQCVFNLRSEESNNKLITVTLVRLWGQAEPTQT